MSNSLSPVTMVMYEVACGIKLASTLTTQQVLECAAFFATHLNELYMVPVPIEHSDEHSLEEYIYRSRASIAMMQMEVISTPNRVYNQILSLLPILPSDEVLFPTSMDKENEEVPADATPSQREYARRMAINREMIREVRLMQAASNTASEKVNASGDNAVNILKKESQLFELDIQK